MLVFQRWYTDTDANCQPGNLEDCRVGVPLSAVPSGNITWWVRAWSTDGYSPWTTGQVVGPPGPYFADINWNGTTLSGNNTSSARLSLGTYRVTFGRIIDQCAFSVMVPFGAFFGYISGWDNNFVEVHISNHDATATIDARFHLTVTCP